MSEKVIVGCSGATLVLCALPWWSMRGFVDLSINAFDSTWGVFTFLCALATIAAIFGVKTGVLKVKPDLALRLPLFAAGGATVCALLFIASGPGGDMGQAKAFLGDNAGNTIWPWVALLLMGAAAFVAFQRVTAANRTTD